MAIKFGVFCDSVIFISLCTIILVLPASIGLLSSFAGLTILFYLFKKINQIIIDWTLKASGLSVWGKINFVWQGFAPPFNFLNRPLQFLTLAILISVVFSHYPSKSLFALFGKFLKSLFLYFSCIEVFKDEKRIGIFVGVMLGSAFLMSVGGVIQHFSGMDFIKGNLIQGERINASFHTANGLGAYFVPIIGLALSLLYSALVQKRSWFIGGLLAILSFFLLTALCWTFSRSAWVGYLISLGILFLLDYRKVLFIGSLILVFIFIFSPSLNHVRHLFLINDDPKATERFVLPSYDIKEVLKFRGSGRLVYWEKAISIIRSSPVTGTGLNTYAMVIRLDPNPQVRNWYAHNCYLQMAAETGLLGLACFLYLLFVLLWQCFRHCHQVENSWDLAILQGAISGLCGFLVQSFFDNTFYNVQLGVLMWLFFGLMVALTRLPALQKNDSVKSNMKNIYDMGSNL